MFERYTEPARRAIFFARARALFSEAPEITSVDLLAALLWEDNSRAQTLFHLRDYFPLYTGCPRKVTTLPEGHHGPPLDSDSKQVLAWTASEATINLRDYWIDTEHMLLGILRTSIFIFGNDRVDPTRRSQDNSRQQALSPQLRASTPPVVVV